MISCDPDENRKKNEVIQFARFLISVVITSKEQKKMHLLSKPQYRNNCVLRGVRKGNEMERGNLTNSKKNSK